MACTENAPCLRPVLRWWHSRKCQAATARGVVCELCGSADTTVDMVECPACGACPLLCDACSAKKPCPTCSAPPPSDAGGQS